MSGTTDGCILDIEWPHHVECRKGDINIALDGIDSYSWAQEFITPEQARATAKALIEAADKCEAGRA